MQFEDSHSKKRKLSSTHQRLAAQLKGYRGKVDDLFRFMDPEVQAKAMQNVKKLSLHEATRLLDRITYLTRTRIVKVKRETVSCTGKVIYDLHGAKAKVKMIWNKGRGQMRIYKCPYCQGHHLTHTAHYGSDRQVA